MIQLFEAEDLTISRSSRRGPMRVRHRWGFRDRMQQTEVEAELSMGQTVYKGLAVSVLGKILDTWKAAESARMRA